MTSSFRILHEGLVWPESPRWHAGALWVTEAFAETSGVRVLRSDGALTRHFPVSGGPAGLDFLSDGTAVLAAAFDQKLLALMPGADAFTTFADLEGTAQYPNELIVGPDDRIYVSDSGFRFDSSPYAPGRLLSIDVDGEAKVVVEDLAFPNGIAVSPDAKRLHVAETLAARITSFDIGAHGFLSEQVSLINFDQLGLHKSQVPSCAGRAGFFISEIGGGTDAAGCVKQSVPFHFADFLKRVETGSRAMFNFGLSLHFEKAAKQHLVNQSCFKVGLIDREKRVFGRWPCFGLSQRSRFPRRIYANVCDQKVNEHPHFGRQYIGLGIDQPQDIAFPGFKVWKNPYQTA